MSSSVTGFCLKKSRNEPSNHILRLSTQMDIIWEGQMVLPIYDFLIRVVRVLRTEWWVTNEAFEHDGSKGPEVAFFAVTLEQEDLRGDIVWCTHSRVGLNTFVSTMDGNEGRVALSLTSFLLLAFQVAICSLLLIVRWIGLTMTLFLDTFTVLGAGFSPPLSSLA